MLAVGGKPLAPQRGRRSPAAGHSTASRRVFTRCPLPGGCHLQPVWLACRTCCVATCAPSPHIFVGLRAPRPNRTTRRGRALVSVDVPTGGSGGLPQGEPEWPVAADHECSENRVRTRMARHAIAALKRLICPFPLIGPGDPGKVTNRRGDADDDGARWRCNKLGVPWLRWRA